VVIAAAVAGIAIGDDAIRAELERQLLSQLGRDTSKVIMDMLDVAAKPHQGAWAAALGAVVLMFGAASLFIEFRSALRRIWRQHLRPVRGGVVGLLITYALAIGAVVTGGMVLMVSLIFSASLAGIQGMGADLPGGATLWRGVEFAASLLLNTLVFALVFHFASRFSWRHVWFGAAVTAALYAVGKAFFGLYLELSGIQSAYGAAGAVVVFLVWVYYTAQIVLYGAEVVSASAEAAGI
jgi:membrane protein